MLKIQQRIYSTILNKTNRCQKRNRDTLSKDKSALKNTQIATPLTNNDNPRSISLAIHSPIHRGLFNRQKRHANSRRAVVPTSSRTKREICYQEKCKDFHESIHSVCPVIYQNLDRSSICPSGRAGRGWHAKQTAARHFFIDLIRLPFDLAPSETSAQQIIALKAQLPT